MTIRTIAASTLGALALTLTACGSDPVDARISDNVADTDQLSQVSAALAATGLDGVLEGEGSYTLLAPDNAAFEALGEGGAALLDDPANGAILAAVLREHIVPGAIDPQSIRETIMQRGGAVQIVNYGNGELTIEITEADLVITNASGQAALVTGDAIVGENGVIIPIDRVLVDPARLRG